MRAKSHFSNSAPGPERAPRHRVVGIQQNDIKPANTSLTEATNPSVNTSISVRVGLLPSAIKRNNASSYSTGGVGVGAGTAGGSSGDAAAAVVADAPSCSIPWTRADNDARSPRTGDDMGPAGVLCKHWGGRENEVNDCLMFIAMP